MRSSQRRGGVTYYLTEVIKKSFGAATARRQSKYAHSVALKSSPPKLPPACRRGKNRIKRKREKTEDAKESTIKIAKVSCWRSQARTIQ